MKSELSTLESNKVKLSVEVDESEIDAHVDEAFKKIATEINLPGFRPGKAPRKVLEARIGKEYARGEAIREALPEYYRQAIVEHGIDVIAPPDLDITDGEEAGAVSFDAIVEIRPEITIAGYNGLRIEIPAPVATDEEVDAQLDSLRNQFSEREAVDRPATDGDYVTMDISGTLDDEPVDGLTADDYTYEVGTGFVVDELDDELRGAKIGDIKEFSAEHPDPDEGDQLTFRVLVKKVEENKLPEVDDDFAKEATEFDTAEELKTDTRQRIETSKRSQSSMLIADRTAEALADLVTDEIPDALVEDQMQNQLQDMAMRLAQQGMQLDQFLQATGQSAEDLRENMREPAAQSAKVDLALRAVAAAEGFEISDDEIQAEIDESAVQLGQEAADLRQAFEDGGQLNFIRADMLKRKAMEMLVESVEIVDPDGNVIDRADLEPVTEDDDSVGDTESDGQGSARADDENSDDADTEITGNTDAESAVGDSDESADQGDD